MLAWQAVEQGFESLLREYNQVRDDVAQGLGFYGQLQEAVKTLHQEVGDYCLARSLPLSSALLPCPMWLYVAKSMRYAPPECSHNGMILRSPKH